MKAILRAMIRWATLTTFRVSCTVSPTVGVALRKGGALVTANHVSLLDGVLLAMISPAPLTFAVHTDFSRHNRVTKAGMEMLAWLGFGKVVPLDNFSPFSLRGLANELKAGGNVAIFPEGGIAAPGAPLDTKPGATWLARFACSVVHCRIEGAEHWRWLAKRGKALFPRIRMTLV